LSRGGDRAGSARRTCVLPRAEPASWTQRISVLKGVCMYDGHQRLILLQRSLCRVLHLTMGDDARGTTLRQICRHKVSRSLHAPSGPSEYNPRDDGMIAPADGAHRDGISDAGHGDCVPTSTQREASSPPWRISPSKGRAEKRIAQHIAHTTTDRSAQSRRAFSDYLATRSMRP